MAYTGPTIADSSGVDVATSSTGSRTLTVTSGTLLIALFGSSNSTAAEAANVTDSQGNTWTRHIVEAYSNRSVSIWCATATASESITITGTYTSSTNWHFHCLALDVAAEIDTSSSFRNSTVTNTFYAGAVGQINTTTNVLIVSINSLNAVVTDWAATTGFTRITAAAPPLTHVVMVQYKQAEAAETAQRCQSITTGSSRNGPGVVASFKASAVSSSKFLHYIDPMNGGF